MNSSPTSSPHVILASASPRRRELLRLIGIAHTVVPADIDESILASERGDALAERLARGKASVVSARYADAFVVAADTVVVLDGQIMGKPANDGEALEMLRALSGATHTVFTGMACAFNGAIKSALDEVSVTFRELSDRELQEYVATGEPLDKAGSYGIQGYGSTIVERIDGDFFAVMGLSLVRLISIMKELGVDYRFAEGARIG